MINWFYVWGGIVILVILGITSYTYKEITRAKRKKDRTRDIYRNGIFAALRAKDDGALYSLIEGVDRRANGEQSEEASDEIAAATRTLMLWTAVLAAATVLMAYFAYFTLDAIRGQLGEMVDAQRPWVKVTPAVDKVIFSDWNGNKQIQVNINFILRNTGPSPAVNIHIVPSMLHHPFNTDTIGLRAMNDLQKRDCDAAREEAINNPSGGVPVFSGDTQNVSRGVGSPVDDTNAYSIQGCVDYSYSATYHGRTTCNYSPPPPEEEPDRVPYS
jgi:hypothetical protein